MMPRYLLFPLALLALGLAALPASAATVTYSATVPLQTTDWSTTLDFPKFDPMTGMLTSVTVEVRDSLVHKIEYENTSTSSGSTFHDSTYVTVDVMRPASTSLVTAISKLYKAGTVALYDGAIDYAGTSGVTFDGLVNCTTWSSTTAAPADLALFTGAGNVTLPCQAAAYFLFSYSGGNANYRLTTQAAASVTLTYTYTAVVPAQATSWGRIKSLYR
jgi:hypothetical protein